MIDLASPVPVYEQVRTQVTELVEGGGLPVGFVLPSVRQLAADFGVAPGTVARAYRELKVSGVVTTSRFDGTRVAAPPQLDRLARADRLAEAAARMVGSGRRLGASDEEIRGAITDALEDAGET